MVVRSNGPDPGRIVHGRIVCGRIVCGRIVCGRIVVDPSFNLYFTINCNFLSLLLYYFY